MFIQRIDPPIPLVTSKGNGFAYFLIDYSSDHDLVWIVFIDETGECWSFRNPEIRLQKNLTFGRVKTSEIT